MPKQYLIFDFDGTLVDSLWDTGKTILSILSEVPDTNINKANEYFLKSTWTPLIQQIEEFYTWRNINSRELSEKIYAEFLTFDWQFFPWVREKIQELAGKYTLFLTTGNSTPVAEKNLKKAGIYEYFAIVLGSEKILKWHQHLEIFGWYSQDKEFYQKSIYIGDGSSDRDFAREKWIDFIHIGNSGIDKYEIPSVVDIDSILNLLT